MSTDPYGDYSAGHLPNGATVDERMRHTAVLIESCQTKAAPLPGPLDVEQLGAGMPHGGDNRIRP